MHQITSALKPFHICPRCSKFQLKRNRLCKSCDFEIAGWGSPDGHRQALFSTGKYYIIQNKNIITGRAHCYVSSKERAKPAEIYRGSPKIQFELDIEISLRATDDDIEKLMLLM